MTEPETTQSVPDSESATAATAELAAAQGEPESTPEPEPTPEPWTPERVNEWNAYYDRYVMGAALLLTLIVACNYLADSSIFLHLRAGQLINEQASPIKTDVFSYTEEGRPWVDVPWLFQSAHAGLYNLIHGVVPVDPADKTASEITADRFSIRGLVLLKALAWLAAGWVLLRIRHRGPGLWWSAICVTIALGVCFDPLWYIAPGGIATVGWIDKSVSGVSPAAWGPLFLAIELLLLFRAFGQGRPRYLWFLIPLFALWANWDLSFFTGLLILAAAVVGHWLDGGASAPVVEQEIDERSSEGGEAPAASRTRPVPMARAWMVLGLCAVACLVNPWTYQVYATALTPFVEAIRQWTLTAEGHWLADANSFFGDGLQRELPLQGIDKAAWTGLAAFYLVVLFAGFASFWINFARFSWSRFLPFLVISILWGVRMRHGLLFAPVFAAVLALNGQEWYHARFGTRGRLGSGWTLWSTGGRVVTLTILFALVGLDITGWNVHKPGIRFGLGYRPDTFPLEAAAFLDRFGEITGNVLNTSASEGDALIWKASSKRKTFLDSRTSLFPRPLFEQWHEIRRALKDDDVDAWKPKLDEYKVSAVMIEPGESPNTYVRLKESPNWIAFYDDGLTAMFGRADAPAADLAFFKANRLEPDRVYRIANPVPPAEGPPTPTSWVDEIFQNRAGDRTQMRSRSAWRWLKGGGYGPPGTTPMPEPARCFMAIQDARIALARNPEDALSYRVLSEAYSYLAVQETALLAGLALTAENRTRISTINPTPDRLYNRFLQRVTALNYAILTTPPPDSEEARDSLFELQYQLYELYQRANFHDLARDRLKIALDLKPSERLLSPEMRAALQQQLAQLDQFVDQVDSKMSELELEQGARPIDLAMFARQQGAAGVALKLFAEAESNGDSMAVVKPQLLDLYCSTGSPDKAMELLNVGAIADPNLGTEPGVAAYRQGLVYYLLGNYLSAASLWRDRSIKDVRDERSSRLLSAGKNLSRGEALVASNQFLGVPASLEKQAKWEFDVAMCQLEGGMPIEAADHFTRALVLEPNFAMRPIIAYYLEKLGKPVPPARDKDASKSGAPAAKSPADAAKPAGSATTTAPPGPSPNQPVKAADSKPAASEPKSAPPSTEAASPASTQPQPAADKPGEPGGEPKKSGAAGVPRTP